MNKPIPAADLPAEVAANWTSGQIVAPNASDVGLATKYGYNFQATQINKAGAAIAALNDAFADIHNVAVYTGTSAPSSSLGVEGDIYIQTE